MMKNGCEAGCKVFTGGEIKHHKDCQYYAESMSKQFDDLQSEVKNLRLYGVSNWLVFDEVKPEADKLFLITNGSFVEIAYYEDGEIMKPWGYDKYDTATLKAQQNGLKWQYINLPACC